MDGSLVRRRPWAIGAVRRAAFGGLVALRRTNSRTRLLPDFLVVGAQKAGTSTLYASLAAHPQVLSVLRREVHYFDTNIDRGLGWYRAHFPTRRAQRVNDRTRPIATKTGESSPYYLFHPAVPERVRRVLPEVQVIVILRDPVARAVSEYHHSVRHGFETRAIDVALDPDAVDATLAAATISDFDAAEGDLRRRSYVARGYYAQQLARWYDCFLPEQILVLETPELRTGEALARSFGFLGLPEVAIREVVDRNVQRYDKPDRAVLDRLSVHFAAHDSALEELLGRRVSWT